MKTIAITIDEDMLSRVDRLATRGANGAKNRSSLIREAVREYVTRLERQADDLREAAIIHRRRDRLAKQARALVHEQAEP